MFLKYKKVLTTLAISGLSITGIATGTMLHSTGSVHAADTDPYLSQYLDSHKLPDDVSGYRLLKAKDQMPAPATMKAHDKNGDTIDMTSSMMTTITEDDDFTSAKGFVAYGWQHDLEVPDSQKGATKNGYSFHDNGTDGLINFSSKGTKARTPTASSYRTLMNGYPAKTASQLGVDSPEEAYMATQIAVWVDAAHSVPYTVTDGEITWKTDAQSKRIHSAYDQIRRDANKDTRELGEKPGNLGIGPGAGKSTAKGNERSTIVHLNRGKAKNGSQVPAKDVKLTKINVMKGAKVYQDGKELKVGDTVPNADGNLEVIEPASTTDTAIHLEVSGSADYANPKIYNQTDQKMSNGKTHAEQFTPMATIDAVRKGTSVGKIDVTNAHNQGYVTVKNTGDKNSGLAGSTFDLYDANNNTKVASGKTDSNGTLKFNAPIVAGDYNIKQTGVDAYHQLDQSNHKITVSKEDIHNGNKTVTINNKEVADAPKMQTSVRDEQNSQTLDPVQTDLTNTVRFTKLDQNHGYKLTSTLFDVNTGKVASVNGEPVTGSVNFTAKSAVETHAVKLSGDFSKAQGHKYAVKTVLERDASNNANDGKQLGVDNNDLGDFDDTLEVAKPSLKTESTADANKVNPHIINPSAKTTLTTKTTAKGLVKGHNYTANIKLMVKNSDGSLSDTSISNVKDFTATGESQDIPLTLTDVDTTDYRGRDLAVVYQITQKGNDRHVIDHQDANDKNTKLQITDPQFKVYQTLGGQKSVSHKVQKAHLVQVVKYSDVAPGEAFKVNAVEKTADDQDATLGKQKLFGTKVVTPEKASGRVKVNVAPVDSYENNSKTDDVTDTDETVLDFSDLEEGVVWTSAATVYSNGDVLSQSGSDDETRQTVEVTVPDKPAKDDNNSDGDVTDPDESSSSDENTDEDNNQDPDENSSSEDTDKDSDENSSSEDTDQDDQKDPDEDSSSEDSDKDSDEDVDGDTNGGTGDNSSADETSDTDEDTDTTGDVDDNEPADNVGDDATGDDADDSTVEDQTDAQKDADEVSKDDADDETPADDVDNVKADDEVPADEVNADDADGAGAEELAQTGSSAKLSHSKVYNFFYGWLGHFFK